MLALVLNVTLLVADFKFLFDDSIDRAPPFEPKPSLQKIADFLFKDCVKKYFKEPCASCKKQALPQNPKVNHKFEIDLIFDLPWISHSRLSLHVKK